MGQSGLGETVHVMFLKRTINCLPIRWCSQNFLGTEKGVTAFAVRGLETGEEVHTVESWRDGQMLLQRKLIVGGLAYVSSYVAVQPHESP